MDYMMALLSPAIRAMYINVSSLHKTEHESPVAFMPGMERRSFFWE
jgi:hypothetical protein